MYYKFPEKNVYRAREVLATGLDINLSENKTLYVNLDNVRIKEDNKKVRHRNYVNTMKTALKVTVHENNKNTLDTLTPNYAKILFSGYRGSGKTVELYRFHHEVNNADCYFSVFIDLERELEMENFKYEDYFIQLIYRLAREIEERKVFSNTNPLDEIIEEWIREEEIKTEITQEAKLKGEANVGAGFNFLNFFKAKFGLKAALATNTKTAKIIRTKIQENTNNYIARFNNALTDIRAEINRAKQGVDILFVIDGFEKAPIEMYEKIFVNNAHIVRNINANIITGLPIDAHFKAKFNVANGFFENVHLPITKINDESIKALKAIIGKRIDLDTFFESEEVVDYVVAKSGGLIRQLLHLVRFSLLYKDEDKKLNMEVEKEIVEEYGRRMYERLNSEQFKILKEVKNNPEYKARPANEQFGTLIYNLFIIKHNGSYKINPVLDEFIN